MNDIIIDVKNNSIASLILDEKNNIHQGELIEASNWIDVSLKYLENIESKPTETLADDNTITVIGTRGSGKTTFLKTLLAKYKEHEELKRVKILDIIDPTLIEEKGHIFLTIISIIKELVESALLNSETNNNNYLQDLKSWEDTVNRLAGGLPSMDGIGKNFEEHNWQDPEFIMEKGIQSVSSARSLRSNFNIFISEALRHINRKAFLIAFDDIDIDFRKGWAVLEMIRKYLSGSRIVIIISGDIRLYSLSIRKQYWTNFGKALLDNEADLLKKHKYYNDLVTEMEGQYLLKILKPIRRIHLSTLYDKVIKAKLDFTNKEHFKIKILLSEGPVDVESAYKNILRIFGINNSYQAEAYVSYLLGLPIRTQIQFLSEYISNNESSVSMYVLDVFLSDLLEKTVDTNLIEGNPYLINIEILKLLLREKELSDLYQLQPTSTDGSLNGCLTSLSLFSSQNYLSNPYLIFDYFIKIGFIRNLLNSFPYFEQESRTNLANTPSIEGLCKHSGVFQNKVLRDIVGNVIAYIRGAFPGNNIWAGTITLHGLGFVAKQKESYNTNRIDVAFKSHKSLKKLAYFPLSICQYSTRNDSITCYSIYTLLGAIGELIRKTKEKDLSRGFAELSQIRTYLMPEFRKKINEGNESNTHDEDDNSSFIESKIDDLLISKFELWVNSYPVDLSLSPHFLGKISTRFFFALTAIESKEEARNLGHLMHFRIIALFNAILIEEAREKIDDFSRFNLNNTNFSDKLFINNLNGISQEDQMKLKFTKWMITNPILCSYLNLKPLLIEALGEFTLFDFTHILEANIYEVLRTISVKENRINKNTSSSTTTETLNNTVEVFKNFGLPYSLFKTNLLRREVVANNNKIRAFYRENFNDEYLSSMKLREIKRFIEKNNISW